MSSEQRREAFEQVLLDLVTNLSSNAIGEVPVVGLFASAFFDAFVGAFTDELDDLRKELLEAIDERIETLERDDLMNDITGLRDGLTSYKENGEHDNQLIGLNQQMETAEARILGPSQAKPADALTAIVGFQVLRMAVWGEILKRPQVAEVVNVELQAQDYIVRAMQRTQELCDAFVAERVAVIRIERHKGNKTAPLEIWDGDRHVITMPNRVFNNGRRSRKAANDRLGAYQSEKAGIARAEVATRFLEPVRSVQVACGFALTEAKDDVLGATTSRLADQFGDLKPAMCPPGKFVTGVQLYKHHNNLALALTCATLDGDDVTVVKEDSLGATTPHNLSSQFGDTKELRCPPGKAMIGFAFYKHHNNLAPKLICADTDWQNHELIFDDSLGATTPENLKDQFGDAKEVKAPSGHVVVGFQLYKHHNNLAPKLLCASVDAVRIGFDFRAAAARVAF